MSEWMALFRDIGFEVENYVEAKAPDSTEGTPFWIPADHSKSTPRNRSHGFGSARLADGCFERKFFDWRRGNAAIVVLSPQERRR
jgi:hypothetical protein